MKFDEDKSVSKNEEIMGKIDKLCDETSEKLAFYTPEVLSEDYDKKLDRILNFIILHCDYDNMPMNALSKVILSLSHVTNVLSKGFIALIDD